MKHIAMLLTNAFRPDPRVDKEARSLTKAGYRVTIICWDRLGELPLHEQVDGFEVRRIAVRSGYGVGSRQVFYLPRFWLLALRQLYTLKPDIIHCHDLDTTPAGYWYARTHRRPWVFDAHESYPEMTVDLGLNKTFYTSLLFLERHMARRATHMLTVGNLLAQRFRALGGLVSIVGNYQPLASFKPAGKISRGDIGISPDEFVVTYIGNFTQARAILPLIEATEYFSNVTVLLIGDGAQRAAIEAKLADYPCVRYLGQVPQEEVPDYTSLADVIYYGLLANDGNSHYSSPNSLFNALVAGKPLLTTNIGEIAQIVRQENCGLIIEQPTPTLIAAALKQLYDPILRQTLSLNARRAAETKYNWAVAEAELLNVYRQLGTNIQPGD